MRKERSFVWAVTALLVVASMLLASCGGGAAPTQAPAATEAPATQPSAATEAPAATEAATEAPSEAATEAPAATPSVMEITGENYSPDIPEPTEPVTVTWATWYNTETPFWRGTIEAFQKIHPNITIEIQSVPNEEMFDKFLAQIAAGNPPDTATVSDWMTGALAQNDGLLALDDYIAKSNTIKLDDYVPAYLDSSQVDGVQYGLPFAAETTMLFYRTDRFEEAGLDPNHPPETWAEFQEYAEKLTDKDNAKYGYAVFAPESAYYFYPWLWQAGGEQLSGADSNDVVWDSEAGQKAADFYANLAQYSPQDLLNATSWDGRVPFANGDVAMYMAGTWFAGTLLTEFPDATGKWAAAPLPKDQRCATTIAADHLVAFKATKNPEAAYKWIEWLSAPENMVAFNLGDPTSPGTLLPPKQSLLDDSSLYEGRPYLEASKESMACALVSPQSPEANQPNYYKAEELLNEYLGKAFYGEITGAEAVKQAAQEAESALKE